MSLQYARLFQLRACIQLIAEEGKVDRESLATALKERKVLGGDMDKEEGADDIIEQLRDAELIVETGGEYRLAVDSDMTDLVDEVLTFSGEEVSGAGSQRVQADRILSNIMYRHPMLLILAKFVYRNGPVKKYEVTREFDSQTFLGDKMNQFTIEMGVDLLEDAEVIETTDNGYIQGRWPVRLFTHVLREEYANLEGESGSVNEDQLFERVETVYGIDRDTYDSHLDTLHGAGIVSEGSYGELVLNYDTLQGANIHE